MATVASVLALAMALILSVRGLRGQRLDRPRLFAMAVAWGLAIVVLAFLLDRVSG
jgi:ABC-type proline/glycine betaine transport system permease subunit